VALGAFYALFFLLLFSPFARAGRLPGNCDTWYAVAFTNMYLNEARELLGLGSYGSFLHPAPAPFSYGETSVGLAVVPMLLRLTGASDTLSYYVFISLVYAATAFATWLLATLYVEDRLVAALAGLALAASNFLLATIDSPHTVFWGIAFLSLYFYKRFLMRRRWSDLRAAALLAGVQVYFSAYLFLLLGIAVAVVTLADLGRLLREPVRPRALVAPALVVCLLVGPFLWFYATRMTGYFSWRSQAVLFAEFNSLDPQDLLNAMPGNLLYPAGHRFDQRDAVVLQRRLAKSDPSFQTEEFALMVGASPKPEEESYWVTSRRRAFIGVTPYLLAVLCVAAPFTGRRELLALFATGLVIAIGPGFMAGGQFVPTPLLWLYEHFPGFHLFRIPSRAFVLALLAVSVGAAKGLEILFGRLSLPPWGRHAALAAAALLVVVENVPVPMRSFAGESLATPPPAYLRFFVDRPRAVILNLPSGIGYGLAGSADDLYVFNRELVYMNWQTYHGDTIVNGVSGYIPLSRIAVQKLIEALPADEAIAALARLGVDYIVFNRNLVLPGEPNLVPGLRRSRRLVPLLDAHTTAVFGVRR